MSSMRCSILILVALVAISSGLQAQVTVYTNRQAWLAAVAALKVTTIGFEGIAPPGGFVLFDTAAGLTLNGVNFVGQSSGGYGLTAVDSQFLKPVLYDRGTGASLQSANSCCSTLINQFIITLPSNVYAAGADLWTVPLDGTPGNGTDTVKMTVGNSFSATTVTLPYPGLAFLGFVSTSPITTMTYTQSTSAEIPELDNFSFGVSAGSASPTQALPHFSAQNVWTTGVFAVNTNAQPANFDIAFRDDFGNSITLPFATGATDNLSGNLPALGSAYYEASNPSAGLIDGWGQITAASGVVTQALFRENAGGTYYEASVPSSGGTTEFEIPFDATTFVANGAQFYTGFAIANLDSSNPSTITCTARTAGGTIIPNAFTPATGPPTLNPLGHWAGYLFPALTGQRGTIDCVSTTTIAATALRFLGTNAFSSLPVIRKSGSTPTGTQTAALPHIAVNDVWTTGVFIINTGTSQANYSIAFHQDNGASIPLPFKLGADGALSGSLPGLASIYFEAGSPAAALLSGWGQITADASIVIQAIFRENVNGTYYEAAVASNAGSKEFEIPFDATTFAATGAQFFTGFAIANLDAAVPANIVCTARNSAGVVIPNSFTPATGPPALNPLGHWAGYNFPALTGQRGTIDCVSNTTIAATALRFIGTDAFSSLPVIQK